MKAIKYINFIHDLSMFDVYLLEDLHDDTENKPLYSLIDQDKIDEMQDALLLTKHTTNQYITKFKHDIIDSVKMNFIKELQTAHKLFVIYVYANGDKLTLPMKLCQDQNDISQTLFVAIVRRINDMENTYEFINFLYKNDSYKFALVSILCNNYTIQTIFDSVKSFNNFILRRDYSSPINFHIENTIIHTTQPSTNCSVFPYYGFF